MQRQLATQQLHTEVEDVHVVKEAETVMGQDYDEQQSKVNHNSPFVQRARAAANLPQR